MQENVLESWMSYAAISSFAGSVIGSGVGVSVSDCSCLIDGSSDEDFELTSSTSIFLLLPLGAGSSGVRQYVTVLVTT